MLIVILPPSCPLPVFWCWRLGNQLTTRALATQWSLLEFSQGARKQRLCQSHTRCCFRQTLELLLSRGDALKQTSLKGPFSLRVSKVCLKINSTKPTKVCIYTCSVSL